MSRAKANWLRAFNKVRMQLQEVCVRLLFSAGSNGTNDSVCTDMLFFSQLHSNQTKLSHLFCYLVLLVLYVHILFFIFFCICILFFILCHFVIFFFHSERLSLSAPSLLIPSSQTALCPMQGGQRYPVQVGDQ